MIAYRRTRNIREYVSRANCQQMHQHALQKFNHIPNRLTLPFQDAITNSVELATCYEEGKRSKAQSQNKNSKSLTE